MSASLPRVRMWLTGFGWLAGAVLFIRLTQILPCCAPEPGDPDGVGFSEAAAKLASTMKMNLWTADASPVEGGVVHIPIRLNLKPGAKVQ